MIVEESGGPPRRAIYGWRSRLIYCTCSSVYTVSSRGRGVGGGSGVWGVGGGGSGAWGRGSGVWGVGGGVG